MNTTNIEKNKKPAFYKSIVTMSTISLFLALGVGIFQTNPENYKGDITNPGTITSEDYLGMWCGYNIEKRGENSSIEENTTVLCRGENPKNNCPAEFAKVSYSGLASAGDTDYYTFSTCVLTEANDQILNPNDSEINSFWCGYHGENQGDNDSVTSTTINCQEIDPKTSCPANYQQIKLQFVNNEDEGTTIEDLKTDTIYSCVHNSGNEKTSKNSWFGWHAIDGTETNLNNFITETTINHTDKNPQTGCSEGFRRIAVLGSAYGDDIDPNELYFCVETGTCGDGSKAGSEECDDGNTNNEDGCSSECLIETDWQCDNTENSLSQCFSCGNGVLEEPEECDDGNTDNEDGCSDACAIEATYDCYIETNPSSCSVLPFFQLNNVEVDYKKQVISVNGVAENIKVIGIGKDWYDTCTYDFNENGSGITGGKTSEFEFSITGPATDAKKASLNITCTCDSTINGSKCEDHISQTHTTTAEISVIAEDYNPLSVNLLQQTIYIGQKPENIVASGGSGSYSFQFSNNGTGLSGTATKNDENENNINTYSFNENNTAISKGVATLTITDNNSEEVINVSIEVQEETLSANLSSQTIGLYDTPTSIETSGGSGEYSFSLNAGTTGLTGSVDSENNNIYNFSTATSTGTATLTITDNKTNESVDVTINVIVVILSANLTEQTIGINKTPFSITASGGSGEYSFSLNAGTTGLTGSVDSENNNIYNFSTATNTGTATLTITDNDTNESVKAIVNVGVTNLSANLTEQTIGINKTPFSITASGGSGEYSFSLNAGTTGLTGSVDSENNNIYNFSTATSTGTATLTITDNDTNESITTKINIMITNLSANLSSQTISINSTPLNIIINGGSGDYSFSLDAGTTGLTGSVDSENNNIYNFSTATSTGTATLTITDNQTNENIDVLINISASGPSVDISSQTINLNGTPASITVNNGSNNYSFSLDAGTTGLTGSVDSENNNIYNFSTATNTGTATLTITDNQTNTSVTTVINVSANELSMNFSSQTVAIGKTPTNIEVNGGSGNYSFSLDAGTTGLTGSVDSENNNIYNFSTATNTGTATLTITDNQTNTSVTTVINVSANELSMNFSSQTVAIGKTPTNIEVNGGSGNYSFSLDAGTTGLTGSVDSENNNIYNFSTATNTGTATLTITDNQTNTSITATINIKSVVLNIENGDQSITVGSTPNPISISGGSGTYTFATTDNGTGLEGTINGDTFIFSKSAEQKGIFTIQITDTVNNVSETTIVTVNSLKIVPNIASQSIAINQTPLTIKASGGSGEYTFELSADEAMGISGSSEGNTFTFNSPALTTGTITLNIYDTYDQENIATSKITVYQTSPVINISEQSIFVGETPKPLIAYSSSDKYNFVFDEGDTKLLGQRENNNFVFTQSALRKGTAVVNLTEEDMTNITASSTINVLARPLTTNIGSQKINLNEDIGDIQVNGGSGEYIMELDDSDGTGLRGYQNGDTFVFNTDPSSAGTVSLNITDYYDDNLTKEIVIIIESTSLSLNINSQIVDVDELPDPIIVTGGSGEYIFTFNPNETGLKGSITNNVFSFTSAGDTTGEATLEITDKNDESKTISTTITVNDSPLKSLSINLLNCNYGENLVTGDICTLIATGTYEDETIRDISKEVEWRGTESIGSVSEDVLTISTAGITTISAVQDGIASNNNITINVLDADKLVSFEVSSLNCEDSVMVEDVCTLSAVGTFEDGNTAEVGDLVNWYGYSSIASLSDRDLTITNDGSANIKGSIVNSDEKEILCNNSITLTAIDKKDLTDIEISSNCTDNTASVNDICILTAIGTYADGTNRDISGQVEWLGTEAIGTLTNYYLTIVQEGTAKIYATMEDEISNTITINSERALLDIISITTTGNASAAKGTTDTLYIDILNLYGIDDLKTVEISLVKGRYCSVNEIPSSAQVFNIINDSASASYSFTNELLTLEIPIYIPQLADLTNGKHTIVVRVSSTAGLNSEIYPFNVGIPASGDVNYDGVYSLTDAILAMKFYSGSAEADATQLEASDFNDNGMVDLLDVIAVFRAVIDTQNGETVIFNNACE